MNVALIGYRGTGKSTVAKCLAQRLGWDWVDADVTLEQRAGRTIAQIFADEGEPAFRDLESQVLADLVRLDRTVLALGGGVILRQENRDQLAHCGRVVWLTASAETIANRLATDNTTGQRRPNLTTSGGMAEIETLLSQREPLYRQCAQLVIGTEGRSPETIADEIAAQLDLSAGQGRGT